MPLRIREIEEVFDAYNAYFFGNRLTLPDIAVRRMKDDLGRWYDVCDEYPTGLLVLHSGEHPWTWRSTLLHEMLHIAVPDDEDDDHGPRFTAAANRVGRIMGLEPADVSESWAWPEHATVRPIGGWEQGD